MSQLLPYSGGHAVAPYSPVPGQQPEGHDFQRLFAALRKRWRIFAAVAAGFILLVCGVTLLMPKSYTTTVSLLVGRPGAERNQSDDDTALPVLNALVLQSGAQSAETLAQLAHQQDLAADVIGRLSLKTSPGSLLGRVSVKPVVNTALLNLSVSWKTPEVSAQIANAFADAFVDRERDFVRSEAVSALGFISQELPNAQAKNLAAAQRLAEFQSTHGYMDATAHATDVVSKLDATDQKIDAISVDLSEATALLATTRSQLASLSTTVDSAKQVGQNPESVDLRAKLVDVETQLAEARQKYTAVHPAIIALQQQRAVLMQELAAEPQAVVSNTTVAPNPLYQSLQQQAATYEARIHGDEGQLKALKTERGTYKPAMVDMPQQAVEFAAVQEDAKRAANVYNALEQKYNDALVAKSTAISDIIVVQPASADDAVLSPNLRMNLAVAVVLGILLGLAVVYALELLERRAVEKDFAALLGLPVIARIPEFGGTNARLVPWIDSMTVEAFLHLCVTLKLRSGGPIRTLVVLSARRGEGKSTVAYNLAKSLSTLQKGVLLIDADLRQPTVHEKAGCANAVGLDDVLEGSVPFEEAVQHVGTLDILASRGDAANPIVLLQTGFESVLAEARRSYGMVIVDAPALAAVSDALLIATKVDGSLFVVSPDRTDEKDSQRVFTEMAHVGINNLLGIVVNRDASTVNDYSDYFARMKVALPSGAV